MTSASPVTDVHRRQYLEEGYFVVPGAISEPHLALLRDHCARAIEGMHAQMDEQKTDVIGLNERDRRYFVFGYRRDGQGLAEFLFSDLMAGICRATIGEDAWLFFEQYVVKAKEAGAKLDWHQDSGYVDVPHRPYVTCWCALDDVDETNGTVYMLPYSRAGTRERIEHVKDPKTNDRVGYSGPDPGVPVICPAGSIAVFSSLTLHRSGPNRTSRARRVYLAQYAPEIIKKPGGSGAFGLADPFLRDGRSVRDGRDESSP